MRVRLLTLAHARSGEKGDTATIGLIARESRFYPVLKDLVTAPVVKRHFEGICFGGVDRYELDNLEALSFLLHRSLDGGGSRSLKHDAQAKTYSTALLRLEIEFDPAAYGLTEGDVQ
jgi:hypothetical protein